MPAKSAKQERFMQAVANNPKFAKKVGVPVTVGQEFTKSGGGMKKMAGGGKTLGISPDMDVSDDKNEYKKGGSVKRSASSRADGIAIRGKTRA